MEILGAIGGGSFVLASLVVGLTLVVRSSRQGGIPAFAMGMGLLLMGGVGYPLLILARFGTFLSDPVRVTLIFFYLLANAVGIAALCLFNLQVFRRGSAVARTLATVISLGLFLCLVLQIAQPGLLVYIRENRGAWAEWSGLLTSFCLLWAGLESLRYFLLMRRRMALGLADPELTWRFALWAVSSLLACGMSSYSWLGIRMGIDVNATREGPVILGILGLLAAGSLWFAFIPPTWFRHWRSAVAGERAKA